MSRRIVGEQAAHSAVAGRLALAVVAMAGLFMAPRLANANEGTPTSIAHAGSRGWTTPPPPPPPMPASQWTGASAVRARAATSAPAASFPVPTTQPAVHAPASSGDTWTPPSRHDVAAPDFAPSTDLAHPAPLVRRIAQGTPLSGTPSSSGALANAALSVEPVPYDAPAGAWTAPRTDAVSEAALRALDAPAPPAYPAATRRVFTRPAAMSAGACAPSCGLPCMSGISQWHVRGVLGYVFYEGDDPASSCEYWGVDVGRTFCGCWGLDAYYRWNSGKFRRSDPDSNITRDGGDMHHVGLKLTMERSLGSSRFYWWAGVGAGWFWTEDLLDDDDGFEGYAEVGLGYAFSRNVRVRAGLNVHGLDTTATRRNPADDGESRWLWLLAPVVELEFSF